MTPGMGGGEIDTIKRRSWNNIDISLLMLNQLYAMVQYVHLHEGKVAVNYSQLRKWQWHQKNIQMGLQMMKMIFSLLWILGARRKLRQNQLASKDSCHECQWLSIYPKKKKWPCDFLCLALDENYVRMRVVCTHDAIDVTSGNKILDGTFHSKRRQDFTQSSKENRRDN